MMKACARIQYAGITKAFLLVKESGLRGRSQEEKGQNEVTQTDEKLKHIRALSGLLSRAAQQCGGLLEMTTSMMGQSRRTNSLG